MKKPYIITCQKCDKQFCSSNPKQKYHVACKPPKKEFRYNSDFAVKSLFIFNRDRYVCQGCKKGLQSGEANAHHINKNHKDDRATNLVTLCSDCHKKAHSKKIRFEVKDCDFKEDIDPIIYRNFYKKDTKYFYNTN